MVQPWFYGALATAVILAGCKSEREQAPQSPQPSSPAVDLGLPMVEPALDRKAILMAASEIASDHAVGRESAEQQRLLDGRRIALRLRIGCPSDTQASRRVEYRESDNRLRIRVAPEITTETAAFSGFPLGGIEAVEGFWIYHPWILNADCPRSPTSLGSPDPEAIATQSRNAPEAPRVGIARFYTDTQSRVGRRGRRDYALARQLAKGEQASPTGYLLMISGRLQALPDGRVIACNVAAAATAPRCIISAHIDQVSVLHPETEQVLGQWAVG